MSVIDEKNESRYGAAASRVMLSLHFNFIRDLALLVPIVVGCMIARLRQRRRARMRWEIASFMSSLECAAEIISSRD